MSLKRCEYGQRIVICFITSLMYSIFSKKKIHNFRQKISTVRFLIATASFICILNMCTSSDIHCLFLNLNFNDVQEYSCNVETNLNIFVPNTQINMIIGFNAAENIKKINGLSILNKHTEYLSINLGEKFSNLTSLRVKDGRLKKVDKDDLKSMPNLRFIDFDSNDLEVIERVLFQYNPNLECIQLDGNHIKSVGLNAFTNLKKLHILDMSSTDCVNGKLNRSKDVKSLISDIEKRCNNSTAYYNYL